MWCKRCGKHTSMLKHVRQKITKNPCSCSSPNGPLLVQEGHNMVESRLDRLERELNTKYNKGGHTLQWNRKLGKHIGSEGEGWLHCLRCNRWWRWKDRVCNLSRAVCTPTNNVRVAKRITGKQPVSHLSVSWVARDEPSSSSSARPVAFERHGVG